MEALLSGRSCCLPGTSQRQEGTWTPAEDKWTQRLLTAFAQVRTVAAPGALQRMQDECTQALRTQRMPTTRNEEYRFTDVSRILQSTPQPASQSPAGLPEAVAAHKLEAAAVQLVVVDGVLNRELSRLGGLPEGVYVGSIGGAPASAAEHLGQQARTRGSPFALINGATAQDAVCIHVPAGMEVPQAVHVLYIATGDANAVTVSCPRLLAVLEERAYLEVLEEFSGAQAEQKYFTNAVAEFVVHQGASLVHKYVQLESNPGWHMKATLVSQAQGSRYALTEAMVGASLARHDLGVAQLGRKTETTMRSFILCGEGQLHDLHSKLRLHHPAGTANQLHKCIVAASSARGVFDGNVKVERAAQQTDAGQLSRNLLLAEKATVNVKPNLQIIADDVKCTHGCAVSDLQEDQLFYFRARGVDPKDARRVLVYSFGAEVTQHLKHPDLMARLEAAVTQTLGDIVAAAD
ncbi:hypothetical protein WJX72_005085 [[Myrmecia] bisecta]|uniref:Uncharacterized protein n=1 Tax=[Myrmecia] bisecta TaxID=41462 RepID=A0AAW1P7S2_9CHLO